MPKKTRTMPEEVKTRLREKAAKQVRVGRLTPADWMVACDYADDSPQRSADEIHFLRGGRLLRAPSHVPADAVEVLRRRLPHVMVTLSAGPGKTRRVPAFHWPTLMLVYRFLGVLRYKGTGEPRLVTRAILFPGRCLPLKVVTPC